MGRLTNCRLLLSRGVHEIKYLIIMKTFYEVLNMIKLFNLGSVLTIILISTTALTAAALSLLADTNMRSRDAYTMNAYGQTGSMATLQNIGATICSKHSSGCSSKDQPYPLLSSFDCRSSWNYCRMV